MTDEEIIRCMKDFFERVPKTVEQRIDLEAWARMNPYGAVEAIKAYISQRQEEKRREAMKMPEGEIIMAEEYFTDAQKVRIVAAMHEEGRYGNDNRYGVTKADEQISQLLFETVDTKSYDWEISLAMLESCFRYVREDPEADPWLLESVKMWDDWTRDTIYIVSEQDNNPSGR